MRIWRWVAPALVGLAIPAALASAAAPPSLPAAVAGPEAWVIYGTPALLRRDPLVPGAGSVVAPPLARKAEPWTSGAAAPIAPALAQGERLTVAFWARSASAETLTLSVQAREKPYAAFYVDRVALTPRWRRFVRTATAPMAYAAATQAVTLQLGEARSAVTLGPVAILEGSATPAQVDAAFASFRPDQVTEAVTIPSDRGVTLAGTLRTPVSRGEGPFPLAIFVQGHGPNGRGGFGAIMDRLLADGIATLDYDKRGIGGSTGPFTEELQPLTRDARAAVAAMRRHRAIDGARIAIVGHSQGGAIAPAVAATDPRIAAIVTLAGPVGDGAELFRRSMLERLVASGSPEKKAAPLADAATALIKARAGQAGPQAIAPLRARVIEGFVANGFTPSQAEGALAVIDKDEIHSIVRTHIASDLRSLRIPVLALFGALDPIVTRSDAAAAREALVHNPKARVVVFDGLSHWFQEGARTGSEEESTKLGRNAGSPRLVGLVGDWLRDALAPPPGHPAR